MKTQKKEIKRTYGVPLDMLLDILKIIFRYELPQRIEGVNVKESVVRLSVKYPADSPYRKEAKDNIEALLGDYGYYANGSPEDRSWDGFPPDYENDF